MSGFIFKIILEPGNLRNFYFCLVFRLTTPDLSSICLLTYLTYRHCCIHIICQHTDRHGNNSQTGWKISVLMHLFYLLEIRTQPVGKKYLNMTQVWVWKWIWQKCCFFVFVFCSFWSWQKIMQVLIKGPDKLSSVPIRNLLFGIASWFPFPLPA